jgi:hypothetical protein
LECSGYSELVEVNLLLNYQFGYEFCRGANTEAVDLRYKIILRIVSWHFFFCASVRHLKINFAQPELETQCRDSRHPGAVKFASD